MFETVDSEEPELLELSVAEVEEPLELRANVPKVDDALEVAEIEVEYEEPAVDSEDPDPEPIPPKQPVATPKQENCAVPQNCPNLQHHVSPR